MTIGGQYDVQSGRAGMEKDQEEDQEEDGAMTSNSGKGQLGPGQQRSGNNARNLVGYFSRGGTHHRYKANQINNIYKNSKKYSNTNSYF